MMCPCTFRKVLTVCLIPCVIFSSCSPPLLKAVEHHKLHDEWLYLQGNGRYMFKKSFFGLLKMDDNRKGRFLISNDSVFLVNKMGRNLFALYGYAVVDTVQGNVRVRMTDSTLDMDMRMESLDQKVYRKILDRQLKKD